MKLREYLSRERARSTKGMRPINKHFVNSAANNDSAGQQLISLKDIDSGLNGAADRIIRESIIDPTLSSLGNEFNGTYAVPNTSRSLLSNLVDKFGVDYKGYSGVSSIFNGILGQNKDRSLRKKFIKEDILQYLSELE